MTRSPAQDLDLGADLRDRRALVTGAANGIGLAIASALSRCGARVVLADLDDAAGTKAARDLDQAAFRRADVSSPEECRELVRYAEQALGGVDILVNNAGVQHVAAIEEFPEARWDSMLRLMLTGPFVLMKYALPGMYARGWGRVVNISSVHGLVASPFKSAYVAAKRGRGRRDRTDHRRLYHRTHQLADRIGHDNRDEQWPGAREHRQ